MSANPKKPSDTEAEIDQILNDIEELQQEMEKGATGAPQLKVVEGGGDEDDALSEFRAGSSASEASLEDLADLKDDSEGSGTSLLDSVESVEEISEEVAEEPVEEMVDEEASGEMEEDMVMQESVTEEMDSQAGTLTLKLQGQMTLKLQYEFEGQEVVVGFSDGCLKVQLADGTEFKVPVGARPAPRGKLKRVV